MLLWSSIFAILTGCADPVLYHQVQDQTSGKPTASVAAAKPFSYQNYVAILKTYVDEQGLVGYSSPKSFARHIRRTDSQLPIPISVFTTQLGLLYKGLQANWQRSQSKTLDNIEHDTIRKDFNEPRIHVALVCAAMSCPALRNEPYMGEKLTQQLDHQVRKFLASPHGFRIERKEDRVYLSSIFQWYGNDWKSRYSVEKQFTGDASKQAVLNFINSYLSQSDQEYLKRGFYKISYLDYDWSLNQQ